MESRKQKDLAAEALNGGVHGTLIRKLLIRNFKCIESIEWIDLGRLTLLTGVNSSGKTSMLQCLLLLKQTLSDANQTAILKLNGPLVQLGAFRDVVSHGDTSRSITIGLELDLPARGFARPRTGVAPIRMPPSEGTCRFTVSFCAGQDGSSVVVSEAEASITASRPSANSVPDGDDSCTVSRSTDETWIQYRRHGEHCRIRFYGPRAVEMPVFFGDDEEKPELSKDSDGFYRLDGVASRSYGFVPVSIRVTEDTISRATPERRIRRPGPTYPVRLVAFEVAHFALMRCLDSLSYIGPLREEPRRFYFYDVYGEGRPLDIGTKGEYVAQILLAEAKDEVLNMHGINDRTGTVEPLRTAVDYWLCGQMGMASGVSVEPLSAEPPIYDVRVRSIQSPDEKASILNVGFGISQILPVIVEGLRTRPGNSLILEQPEIHLHPKMQADLSDFLMCLALAKRQVIVETHSDHMINHLRRRVAEDCAGGIREALVVYFAEPTGKGSVLTSINLDDFGCAPTWPHGFFDQADVDMHALLVAQVRRSKAGRNPK